jgi:hypothetical protein
MPLILGTNSIKDTGYNVANSLRFDDGSSDSLSRSFGTPSSTTTWTISFWVKKCTNGSALNLCSQGVGTSNEDRIRFDSSDRLEWTIYKSAVKGKLVTNRLFRDNSAWYNVICRYDSTNGTAGDRMKIFINGSEETSFSTDTNPDQNETSNFNTSATNYVGSVGSGEFFDGYMAEVVFTDGQALDATSFGEFDEDSPTIWKPKDVSGLTFGTNGFYLEFKQSGTSQNSSGLGADTSGQDNHFAVSNLTSVDQSIDTCTNNFAILNNLHIRDDWFLEDGGLKFENESTVHRMTNSTIAALTGKWYAEVKVTTVGGNYSHIGVINPDKFVYNTYLGNTGRGFAYSSEGLKVSGNSGSSYGNSFTSGDIIGIAMDLDNSKLYFSKNGTFQNSGDPTSGSTGTGSAFNLASNEYYSFGLSSLDTSTDPVYEWNFGSPLFSISSGNTDGNGFGNFEYAVPSGYFALCTKNLAEFG